ncbi:uncharacterized protein [Aristolochia californica]|uniref:uncharacterized protein n=1 Tax=Aristolochia californica TaxID=171875 RepID=UPI0035DEA166
MAREPNIMVSDRTTICDSSSPTDVSNQVDTLRMETQHSIAYVSIELIDLLDSFQQFVLRMEEFMTWATAPPGYPHHQHQQPPSPPPPMAPLRPAHPVPGGLHANSPSTMPMYTKLDFPPYDGSIDPLIWFQRARHLCKRLFWLEVEDPKEDSPPPNEETPEEEEPAISIHAMTRLHNTNTLQVHVGIQNFRLLALVDSGSTHNFLSQTSGTHLGLAILQNSGLSISIGNGEKLTSIGLCSAVQFVIEGHHFGVDFLVIPLVGFDLVLGIKSLQQLGLILWDFTSLTMGFTLGQHHITLHGTHAPSLCALHHLQVADSDHSHLHSLIVEFGDLFMGTQSLPPICNCDHWIRLKMGTKPVEIRVYLVDVEKTDFRTQNGHFEFLVMPFGLSNAPSTFQMLMNEHSKCSFGDPEVAYLGHVILASGIKVNSTKIQAIIDWPSPQSVTALMGFLGFSGYYRKFILDYGQIAAPLTSLLKKHSFMWSEAASSSFVQLKHALASAPVLHRPKFEDLFIIECDASRGSINMVLQQQGNPIAYFNRQLAIHLHKLEAYERELIGLAKAIQHWRPYLWGHQFHIRTNHCSLKYLLEQRITTSSQ